jgi:uncharacterized protein (DUF342 family)
MALVFPPTQTSVSFDVAVVQEIFRRLDKLDARIEETNDKIDAVNTDLSAKINAIMLRMDKHDNRITALEEKKKNSPTDEEPVQCIPVQGPFFMLTTYYTWFTYPHCHHLKTS